MDKRQYLEGLKSAIDAKLQHPQLRNYYYQTFAKKMGATFARTYDERVLWNTALLLSTSSSHLLENELKYDQAYRALYFAAQIYEIFGDIAESYDKHFCLILASICYDIAGYQANALCLTRDLYVLDNTDDVLIKFENYYLETVQLFLQKKLGVLRTRIRSYKEELGESGIDEDYKDAFMQFFIAIDNLCLFLLTGKEVEIGKHLRLASQGFLFCGNVLLSRINNLIETRYKLLRHQSTWDILMREGKFGEGKPGNSIWQRFIRILSQNIYSGTRFLPEQDRVSIFEFWKSQIEAIDSGIITGNDKSFIIQMPTSAGKTMIAELAILNNLIEKPWGKCIYIAPYKALCSEIEETLVNHLGRLGYRISSVTGTYELDEFDDLLIKESDILISTPEKIDLLLRSNPDYFNLVSLVVFDEGHVLGNVDKRSALIEFLIVRLKRKLKNMAQFLLISAVMPKINGEEFSLWLCQNKNCIIQSPDTGEGVAWQPTRRITGKFSWTGNTGRIEYPSISSSIGNKMPAYVPNVVKVKDYRTFTPKLRREKIVSFPAIDPSTHRIKRSDTAVALADKYSKDGPVLVFCAQPDSVQDVGNSFLRLLGLRMIPENRSEDEHFYRPANLESLEMAEKWMGESVVTECLRWGIGLHYGTMAEPLRKAVESDFKNKRFKVLIATTTLAQGVNLPIKTIIVHSVIRNYQTDDRVTIRDFWNVVGRAGRAGHETEGHIIFLSSNYRDEALFPVYSDPKSIEPVKSIIYRYLLALIESRISSERFNKDIAYLLEPQIVALLVEETVDTPDEEFIQGVVKDSLVSIQAGEIDQLPLYDALGRVSHRFISETADWELRKCFAQTGFSVGSCKQILDYIEMNNEELSEVFANNDLQRHVEMLLTCLLGIKEMEIHERLQRLALTEEHLSFVKKYINLWLKGEPIQDLRSFWTAADPHFTPDHMNLFIENTLNYLLPWGISAFHRIYSYKINRKIEEFPQDFVYLPSYFKYGTTNKYACWAKSVGVPTRETAIMLGNYYASLSRGEDLQSFVRWYSNIDNEELSAARVADSKHEAARIIQTAQRINTNRFAGNTSTKSYEFYVRGIYYEEKRKQLSEEIKLADIVELEREYDNAFDIYAIQVCHKGSQLGYVPRELAKELALNVDLEGVLYRGTVVSKDVFANGVRIKIRITEVK